MSGSIKIRKNISASGIDVISGYANTLHIKAGAIGYNVSPWTNTAKFASIVQDL